MLNGTSYKSNRYLSPNTSHNILPVSSTTTSEPFLPYTNNRDNKHSVFQYPKTECFEQCYKTNPATLPPAQHGKERSRGGPEPDDSLTNMEWLPEVSIPYMQQVRCKISQEDMKKMPRKRNRNVPSTSGVKACATSYRKPEYSYAMLIFKAINDTEEKRMQLFQIYEWIENHYLYYKQNPGTHWKSSIRHNLSQHKIFVKELPPPSLKSKGSFWALDRRMAEKDLLLQIQPKRPRLSRISNGESACVNGRISKGPYCAVLPHYNPHPNHHQYNLHPHRQPLYQHVRNVSRGTQHVQYRQPPQRVQNYPHKREEKPGEVHTYRNRPNILSKVVRRDEKDTSSPPGSSLLNLNQLFHTNNNLENISPGSSSYESGYSSSSLNDSSNNSPKPKSFVCSTPVKNGVWSSPEFGGFKSSPQISSFPLSGEELPNLSHYMAPAADPQLQSCVKEEEKVEPSGEFWSPTYGKHQVFFSPTKGDGKQPRYEVEGEVTVPFLTQIAMSDSYTAFPTAESPCIKEEIDEAKEVVLIETSQRVDSNDTDAKEEIQEVKEEPIDCLPGPKSEDKNCDIADLITQFINEGEVCMLNGTFSTTPLRQYLTEEESSLALDLDSPKRSKKKTPIRRSLNEEMK